MRKVINILIIVSLLIFLCSFTLVKTHNRSRLYTLPMSFKTQIARGTKGMTEKQIIDYSLDLTAKTLQFDWKNDIPNGKANCIGYAQLCAAICNHALKSNGYKCRAKPVVGYIEDCGINLCEALKVIMPSNHWKSFVKDHDFVELSYGGKTYYFDPSIYDVLGNKCLTIS